MRGAFVPGKLQAYLDAQYAPLSDVVQTCVVRHADQLVSASVSLAIKQRPPNKLESTSGARVAYLPVHAPRTDACRESLCWPASIGCFSAPPGFTRVCVPPCPSSPLPRHPYSPPKHLTEQTPGATGDAG